MYLLHSCALGVKHNIFMIVLLVKLNPSYEKRRYVPRTLTHRPVASRNRVVRPNHRISTRSEAQKKASEAGDNYPCEAQKISPQFAALLQQALKARDTASFLLNESLGTHCSLVNVACLLSWDRLLRLCIHCMLGSV